MEKLFQSDLDRFVTVDMILNHVDGTVFECLIRPSLG